MIQLNRKDALERYTGMACQASAWDSAVTLFLPLTPALLAAYSSATPGQRGAATTEQLSYA